MSWLSSLFGGAKSTSKSTSYLPEQATWLKNMLGTYGPEVGQGADIYQGTRVAPLSSAQQGILSNAANWSQYLRPGAMPMYGETGAALSDILAGEMGATPYSEKDVNALFSSAYEAPALREWDKFVLPSIKEAYSGPGYWASSRMEAERQGAEDLGTWLGSQYGNLRWQADQANRAIQEAKAGRALSAIPLGTQYGLAPTEQANQAIAGQGALYNVVSPAQAQQQAEINANIQRFLEENQLTDPQDLQIMLQLLGLGYRTDTQTQRSPGALQQALGAVVGAGLGAATGGIGTAALGALGNIGNNQLGYWPSETGRTYGS